MAGRILVSQKTRRSVIELVKMANQFNNGGKLMKRRVSKAIKVLRRDPYAKFALSEIMKQVQNTQIRDIIYTWIDLDMLKQKKTCKKIFSVDNILCQPLQFVTLGGFLTFVIIRYPEFLKFTQNFSGLHEFKLNTLLIIFISIFSLGIFSTFCRVCIFHVKNKRDYQLALTDQLQPK